MKEREVQCAWIYVSLLYGVQNMVHSTITAFVRSGALVEYLRTLVSFWDRFLGRRFFRYLKQAEDYGATLKEGDLIFLQAPSVVMATRTPQRSTLLSSTLLPNGPPATYHLYRFSLYTVCVAAYLQGDSLKGITNSVSSWKNFSSAMGRTQV